MLAILCYICSPTSSNDLCQSVSNVSECGDKVEGTSTTARLCANISIETLFGGQTTNLNIMKCESKVWLWWSFFFVVHSATILVFRWHTGADLGGGCRGCDPPPWDDLRFSNTTGILPKKKNYVVYWFRSRARDECTPSWKKFWIRPCDELWCDDSLNCS